MGVDSHRRRGERWPLVVGGVVSLLAHAGVLAAVVLRQDGGEGNLRSIQDDDANREERRVEFGLERSKAVSINWLGFEDRPTEQTSPVESDTEQAAMTTETSDGDGDGARIPAETPSPPSPASAGASGTPDRANVETESAPVPSALADAADAARSTPASPVVGPPVPPRGSEGAVVSPTDREGPGPKPAGFVIELPPKPAAPQEADPDEPPRDEPAAAEPADPSEVQADATRGDRPTLADPMRSTKADQPEPARSEQARQTTVQASPSTPATSVRGTTGPRRRRPGEPADREALATTLKAAVDVRPGRVLAGEGLEIKTVAPDWPAAVRATASPQNPVIEIDFKPDGTVGEAGFVRGRPDGRTLVIYNTGSARVDEPLLDAIYRWRASGEQLRKLPPGELLRVTVKIRLR